MAAHFWNNRRVLITGHTGFKGSWLSLWLVHLGARVSGIALAPSTRPNLFELARLQELLEHRVGDICHTETVAEVFRSYQPEVVFHLAAQPIVRRSYYDPITTFVTNVIGTANVLEAIRNCHSVKSAVIITTDKCYENREWLWGYREIDRLGGHDPYSTSKACAELVVQCYQRSYFQQVGNYGNSTSTTNHRASVGVATARAGNVIGGGDWAEDRLIPDAIRAVTRGDVLQVRNPHAVRPWQHVLEPLHGYLILAERLYHDPTAFSEPWNFGPEPDDSVTVGTVLDLVTRHWPEIKWRPVSEVQPLHESRWLYLDCSKARHRLGWRPRWNLQHAVEKTVSWYLAVLQHAQDARAVSLQQISEYETAKVRSLETKE
jgi:CDP-glucose 4,6-dehydratase